MLGLDWDGEVAFQSNRHHAYEAAIERLLADGRLYECFCTRAEIRAAASAPHGPLPEGAYPGTCLRLTTAERRRKRAGGRPPALRVRAEQRADRVRRPPARRAGGRGRRLRRAPQRRRARLQPRRDRRRRVAGDRRGRARRRPAGVDPAPAVPRHRARPGGPGLRARAAGARAGRQPARQASRRGDARAARGGTGAAVDGGDAGPGRRGERRGDASRFDPAALTRVATRWTGGSPSRAAACPGQLRVSAASRVRIRFGSPQARARARPCKWRRAPSRPRRRPARSLPGRAARAALRGSPAER